MSDVPVAPIDAVVIGAGQAGLSAAYHLVRRGIETVVLDRNAAPGGAWQHRWPSMRLTDTNRIYPLPDFPLTDVDPSVPAAVAVREYFGAFEERFGLAVQRPVTVDAVRPAAAGLRVLAGHRAWEARAVVNATGTWDRPFRPYYPGAATFRGRQLHTADYAGPQEFAGKHVVVVGGGVSGVQLLAEISTVASTTWVTRRPPIFRTGPFTAEDGRAAVGLVEEAVRAGRPPSSVVGVTGLYLTPALLAAQERGVLERQPMFARIEPDGVRWVDGRFQRADVILWCTGFRASLDHLAPLGLREPGGGIRIEGTHAVREPRVHLLGYGPSASTIGANRAGRAAAAEIANALSVAA
jgi:hypothetical protein